MLQRNEFGDGNIAIHVPQKFHYIPLSLPIHQALSYATEVNFRTLAAKWVAAVHVEIML